MGRDTISTLQAQVESLKKSIDEVMVIRVKLNELALKAEAKVNFLKIENPLLKMEAGSLQYIIKGLARQLT